MSTPTEKRRSLREILSRGTVTVMPGGFSPLFARMAQQIGFECFFVAGSQTSAFLYGNPDIGLLGLRDMVDHARHVAAKADIPIMVDADTGYGNAVTVHHAVAEFVQSGVAAIQIEDQEAPKKSGTSAGRRCISMAEAIGKYQAAVAARDALDPEFVICARCDVIGAEGGTFDDALTRCIAYVEEGGADFVWLNTVQTRAQLEQACARVPAPVLAIWGGAERAPTLQEYEDLGVRIVLQPTVAARASAQAGWELMNALYADGPEALPEWRARSAASRFGMVDDKTLVGIDAVRAQEERFLPPDKRRDYAHTFGHRMVEEKSDEP